MRLKLLFYIAENIKVEYKFLKEFSITLFSKNSSKFSDTVKDLMKNEFKHILDVFYKTRIDSVLFLSRFFQKESEILKTFWIPQENSSFVFRYLKKNADIEKIVNLTKKNFSGDKIEEMKIFKGRNQGLNILRIIYDKKNETFTNLVFKLTQYEDNEKNIITMKSFNNFHDFINSSNFLKEEIREYYKSYGFDDIQNANNAISFEKIIEIAKNNGHINVKELLLERSLIGNQTHLFKLAIEDSTNKTKFFIELLPKFLNKNEIKQLLIHKPKKFSETFITRAITKTTNSQNIEKLWNFTITYLIS